MASLLVGSFLACHQIRRGRSDPAILRGWVLDARQVGGEYRSMSLRRVLENNTVTVILPFSIVVLLSLGPSLRVLPIMHFTVALLYLAQ